MDENSTKYVKMMGDGDRLPAPEVFELEPAEAPNEGRVGGSDVKIDNGGSQSSGVSLIDTAEESRSDGESHSVEKTTKGGKSYNDVVATNTEEKQDSDDIQSVEDYYRERAFDRVADVRPRVLKRALIAREIVEYAADDESDSEVWDDYADQRDTIGPPSPDEFVASPTDEVLDGWLGVGRFQTLLTEDAGPEILTDEELDEWFSVNDRSLRDLLHFLRHIYRT